MFSSEGVRVGSVSAESMVGAFSMETLFAVDEVVCRNVRVLCLPPRRMSPFFCVSRRHAGLSCLSYKVFHLADGAHL